MGDDEGGTEAPRSETPDGEASASNTSEKPTEDKLAAAPKDADGEPDAAPKDADGKPNAAPKDNAEVVAVPVKPSDTKRNAMLAAVITIAVVVVSLGALAAYGSWIGRDEDRRWDAAEAADTEDGWLAYVAWADEVRGGGGLRSMLATEFSLIWAHAPLAADAALVARATDAIGRGDWPTLCAMRTEHPGTRAETRASTALRNRIDGAGTLFITRATSFAMRPRAMAALRAAFASVRDEHPCEGTGRLRVRHVVDAAAADEASRDLDHAMASGARTVRELLDSIDRDARSRALAEAVLPEFSTALENAYGLEVATADDDDDAADDSTPRLDVEFECALHAHARFITAAGTELPGLALRTTVRFFVRRLGIERGSTPDYESTVDIVLPPDAALGMGGATSAAAVEEIYSTLIDDLYRRAADRLRMELGLMAWTNAAGGGACDDIDPIAPGTVVRANTRDGSDTTWGACSPEYEAYEEASNCYDCGYDEYGDEEEVLNSELVYRLVVAERSRVAVAATSDDAHEIITYVRSSCGDISTEVACAADAPAVATLDPGVYYVFVDGSYGSEGRFRLAASVHDLAHPPDACRSPAAISPGTAVSGDTGPGADAMEASCGGVGASERIHALEVPNASRLRCALTSDADLVVSVRSDCVDPESEVACGAATGAGLRTRLAPGRHTVVVEGYGPGDRGRYALTCELAPDAGAADVVADTCAAPGSLEAGALALDTFRARDDLGGTCGGTGAPDLVYQLDVTAPTHLRATPGGLAPPLLYVQSRCGERASELACAATGMLEADLEPGRYFLVADGASPNAYGAAAVDVALTDLGTACAAALPATRGPSAGTTRGAGTNFRGTCGGVGPEAIYQLTLSSRSHVVIRSQQTFLGVVYVRRNCADWRSELGCSDMDEGHDDRSLVDLTLDSGTYSIFVDGEAATNQGTFTLDVSVENAVESLH